MVKIECSGCRCDLNTGDSIFCEQCFEKLERTIEILTEDVNRLEKQLENLIDKKF